MISLELAGEPCGRNGDGAGRMRGGLRQDGLAAPDLLDVPIDDRTRAEGSEFAWLPRCTRRKGSYRKERSERQGKARPKNSIHAGWLLSKQLGGNSQCAIAGTGESKAGQAPAAVPECRYADDFVIEVTTPTR